MEFHSPLPLGPLRAVGSGSSFTMGLNRTLEPCAGDCRHGSLGPAGEEPERIPNITLPDWGLIPEVRRRAASRAVLVLLATLLLAQSLPRKRFFGPALLAGFHVEAMFLDLLDNVFLLYFALESAQCILKGLILLNDYFCQ